MKTRPSNTLAVFPNPYTSLDAYGNPAGVCPCDPHEHTPDRRWVGTTLASSQVHDKFEKGDLRSPRHDLFYAYNLETPTTLPQTSYYLDRIRSGELFAADAATAAKAGVTYLPLEDALSAATDLAIRRWESMYGQGTCPLSEDSL